VVKHVLVGVDQVGRSSPAMRDAEDWVARQTRSEELDHHLEGGADVDRVLEPGLVVRVL
jgi:hypothetical protein